MSTQEAKYLVAVFPYLKTSNPVRLRGITFRSTDDLSDLTPEEKVDVERIRTRFYLRNSYRIDKMTYTLLRFSNADERQHILDRIAEVRLLLTYLYSAPDEVRCDVFLAKEHCSVCVFEKHEVVALLVRPDENTTVMGRDTDFPKADVRGMLDGWGVTRDDQELFYAELNSHIYSALGRMWFNTSQDLHSHFFQQGSSSGRHHNVLELLRSPCTSTRGLERIKTALSWYNRSVSEIEEPDVQTVNLAIAFESLLDLEQAKGTTARFVETIQTLLGRDSRLEEWLKQFYEARSGLVHKGHSKEFMFRVSTKAWSSGYRSLVDYGRHIFRACVETILEGSRMSEIIGIPTLLTTNRERFERICTVMDGTDDPEEKLGAVAGDIDDIDRTRYIREEALTFEVQISAVQKVVQQYAATTPPETEPVLAAMNEVSRITSKGDRLVSLDAL